MREIQDIKKMKKFQQDEAEVKVREESLLINADDVQDFEKERLKNFYKGLSEEQYHKYYDDQHHKISS